MHPTAVPLMRGFTRVCPLVVRQACAPHQAHSIDRLISLSNSKGCASGPVHISAPAIIDQSVEQMIDQSINRSIEKSTNHSTDSSVNQSINQTIIQSINQFQHAQQLAKNFQKFVSCWPVVPAPLRHMQNCSYIPAANTYGCKSHPQ